ncbi:MAG: hypothetical protein LKG42_00665 [Eubacterium sp.]|jgi:hypothetical protein|nr:hypothetical protein [Eubacterium sp.]MCH4079907.1 hypothetical protein [Eubacterium sp.]MCH4110052.1 hypothetical protein [Eubacterium sp.]MCI1306526.1 hypothetical protein [Eubacterium sp.]
MRTLPLYDAEALLVAWEPCCRLAERQCEPCPSTTLKRRWLPENLVIVWRKGNANPALYDAEASLAAWEPCCRLAERAMRTLPFYDAEASLAAREPCCRLAERQSKKGMCEIPHIPFYTYHAAESGQSHN